MSTHWRMFLFCFVCFARLTSNSQIFLLLAPKYWIKGTCHHTRPTGWHIWSPCVSMSCAQPLTLTALFLKRLISPHPQPHFRIPDFSSPMFLENCSFPPSHPFPSNQEPATEAVKSHFNGPHLAGWNSGGKRANQQPWKRELEEKYGALGSRHLLPPQ